LKWFKHYSNAYKGQVIQALAEEFGFAKGFGLYFLFISFLSDKWDGKSEPEFRFSISFFRKFLQISPKKFQKFVEILQNFSEIRFHFDGQLIEIQCIKLRETLHKDAQSSGVRAQKLSSPGGPLARVELEENKKKSINTRDDNNYHLERKNQGPKQQPKRSGDLEPISRSVHHLLNRLDIPT